MKGGIPLATDSGLQSLPASPLLAVRADVHGDITMMRHSDQGVLPALFRAGDIGVASEWRDLSYDWSPVLTADGVFIYSYLRDTYDHQRNLRPFLLTPEGPTKKSIQVRLGLKSAYAMQGPEYLLCTVGLLHVELGYGSSVDPERPNNTHTAYYVVGRLDHPTLDWTMLEQVLDALMPALEPRDTDSEYATRQRKAGAALRSLGQAGFFQKCDPADLFYPFGAWPHLLSILMEDDRWLALFSHLHGLEAVASYRRLVRGWIEYTQRAAARLMQENEAISTQLLAAQRRGPRGGNSSNGGPTGSTSVSDHQGSHIAVTKPVEVTSIGFITAGSPACHQPIEVTSTGLVTPSQTNRNKAVNHASLSSDTMSLAPDQLTGSSKEDRYHSSGTPLPSSDTLLQHLDDIPVVEPHLRDAELASTRFDAYFWCAVNEILCQAPDRYEPTPGEKQAVFRQFKRQDIPVGVVLAALRAVQMLSASERPQRLSDALKLDRFHASVQQALALLPARKRATTDSWPQFLDAYRRIGHPQRLRDVSTSDYHVLQALFSKQPDECWEVLNRVEHATHVPNLTPAYLRRAIVNNQRTQSLQTLTPDLQRPDCSRPKMHSPGKPPMAQPQDRQSDDPRHMLLSEEGVSPEVLTQDMTDAYIRLWIAEADAREAEIHSRAGWLRWGLASGIPPASHPHLRPRARQTSLKMARAEEAASSQVASPISNDALHVSWQAVLDILETSMSHNEFITWLKPCQLVECELSSEHEERTVAVIETPNIFVRQEVERRYQSQVEDALRMTLGYPTQVHLIIGSR